MSPPVPGATTSKKEALFELVEIPEPFGPVEVVIDDAKVKAYAFAQDDYHPWYFGDDTPFGRRIAHPLVLANDLLFLFYEHYDGNTARGLHTHEELSFHAPIFVGERVTITGAYVEKYERRGQGYVVLEADAHGEDGRLLVHHRGVEIMRAQAGEIVGRRSAQATGRRVTAEVRSGADPVERIAPGLPERTPIASLRKVITQDQMNVFSWAGRHFRNVHTSIARARESGLDDTLIQAQQQVGVICEWATRSFGAAWFTSGALDLRCINPAFAHSELVVSGAVLGDEPGGRTTAEVWITRPDGEKTVVGWASAQTTGGID